MNSYLHAFLHHTTGIQCSSHGLYYRRIGIQEATHLHIKGAVQVEGVGQVRGVAWRGMVWRDLSSVSEVNLFYYTNSNHASLK